MKLRGLTLAAHHRRKLAEHWPEQYGRLIRERTARRSTRGSRTDGAEAIEHTRWEVRSLGERSCSRSGGGDGDGQRTGRQ